MSFSEDGSVLAVAYGALLTLWDPTLVRLLGTIQTGNKSHPITNIHFLPYSPYLLTTTRGSLTVWDALDLTERWRFKGHVTAVAVVSTNPEGKIMELEGNGERVDFVVATAEGLGKNHHHATPTTTSSGPRYTIHFFNMSSPTPLHSQTVPGHVRDMCIITGKGNESSGVAFYTRRDGLSLLSTTTSTTTSAAAEVQQEVKQVGRGRKRPLNAVELVQPPSTKMKRASLEASSHVAKPVPLSDLLDPNTSTLPNPSTLYSSFFHGLLPSTTSTSSSQVLLQQQQQQAPPVRSEERREEKLLSPSKGAVEMKQASSSSVAVGATTTTTTTTTSQQSKPPPSCGVKMELLQLFKESFST